MHTEAGCVSVLAIQYHRQEGGTTLIDEVEAEEVENKEENSVGDEPSCSLPKVYLYILWSTCVHKPFRGD